MKKQKFAHISDLHLGKRLNEYSLIEDQEYILGEILKIIREHEVTSLLISGDVFDRVTPPVDAENLFDSFLTELNKMGVLTFVISGNHDSAERLGVRSEILEKNGIYFTKTLTDGCKKVVLDDPEGPIEIHMVPFIKPANVRAWLRSMGEEEKAAEISSYNDGMKCVLDSLDKSEDNRKILLAHQFITDSIKSDSEEQVIGGLDNIDSEVFNGFDYVALGHLHRPQDVNEFVRYCGTPLKYSLSEISNKNSVTIISFNGRELVKELVPLVPLRNIVEIKGSYEEIMKKSFRDQYNLDDYFYVVLTDESDVVDGASKIMTVYEKLLKLAYERHINADESASILEVQMEMKSPMENVKEFFHLQNGKEMTDYQQKIIEDLCDKVGGGN